MQKKQQEMKLNYAISSFLSRRDSKCNLKRVDSHHEFRFHSLMQKEPFVLAFKMKKMEIRYFISRLRKINMSLIIYEILITCKQQ